jgi:arylformamidase
LIKYLTILSLVSSFVSSAFAQRVDKDIPYVDQGHKLQTLDVYQPANVKDAPILFWIHGGGWQGGDKSDVMLKPKLFNEHGFVFVSINYRLLPEVDMSSIIQEVAKSLRWIHDHAAQYNADPNRIVVGGHSAGAQLAALLCTDQRYLEAERLSFQILRGCIPVDGDTYDLPAIITTAEIRRQVHGLPQAKFGHREKFGNDPAKHIDFSAVTHIASGKNIPPFCVLYVADHPDTSAQAQRLINVLQANKIEVTAVAARQTDHVKLNDNLGLDDDASTIELMKFVSKINAIEAR